MLASLYKSSMALTPRGTTWPLSSIKLFFWSGGAVRPRPSKQAAAQFPGSTILDEAVEESDEQDGRTEEDLVIGTRSDRCAVSK